MNAFTLYSIGRLAEQPETSGEGDKRHTKFTLIGNDFNGTGKDQVITNVRFVAFGATGDALARNCRKGDQLFVLAQKRANNWTDDDGRTHYDYSHVVQSFEFGAPGKIKRAELAAAGQTPSAPPAETPTKPKSRRGKRAAS